MEQMVMEGAQQHQPIEIGAPAVDPVIDVMHIAEPSLALTPRRSTVTVTGDHRSTQRCRRGANLAAEIDDPTLDGEHSLHDRIA